MKISRVVSVERLLLIVLCFVCFFLRSYATYRDLIFTYDQGRDALIMQKIAAGRLTLIGPVTGLDGVFLGPFWYYLIFPFYMLGQGNPVYPAFEMKLFSVGVVILLYLWGRKAKLPWMGLFAGALYTFSFSNILFARWLSNPVPLPFFALLGFYTLWNAIESKKISLFIVTGIIFGCCLQLEAANAFWFIPSVAIIFFVESATKNWKRDLKSILTRMGALVGGCSLTILPQALFELKNHFLITKNLLKAFQTTHDISIAQSIPMRVPLLFELYGRGLFVTQSWLFVYVSSVFCVALVVFRAKLFAHRFFRIACIWFFVPFIFHVLYTGNHGNFWDYYVLAQHVSLYLLLATTIGIIASTKKWKVLALILALSLVLTSSILNLAKWTEIIKPFPSRFSLQEQVDATKWMVSEAQGKPYGAWVYTPSAQDDPYRYIFAWQGKMLHSYPGEHVEQQEVIFLFAEDDTLYWRRRNEWLKDRMKFGTLEKSSRFGAITVYKLKNTFIQGKIVQ